MSTTFIGMVAAFICLVVLFATGKKTPSRSVATLPSPSRAVRALIDDKRILAAIKRYRQESGTSLREAKQVVDSVRR